MRSDIALSRAPRRAPPSGKPGVCFARDLRGYGDRLAVVTPDGGTLSYQQLADRVDSFAQRLGTTRRLVLIAVSNAVDPLVAYLAALAAGHVALLTAADDDQAAESLVAAYDPDVVYRPTDNGWDLIERREGTVHELHPELALLLSTSGSTGSPKLVRLSRHGLEANAASIARYLEIAGTDRAVTSLPMQYCYGLSVVNSNLLCGAGLLLTGESVVDPGFWTMVGEHGATSLHGVPYTFELLERAGFAHRDLPSLRYVTQAGGKLDPALVRRYAELARAGGWRLFVMYGQTEATARIAYLPPELALTRPSSIGVAIPGGELSLVAEDGSAADEEGELVYRGPNVMLGYAESPADLALGRTVDELATGDLARRAPDGLYEIVGRKGRIIKPFGLRVDLDELERMLEREGLEAACTGSDGELVIAVAGDDEAVQRLVAGCIGLPPIQVHVHRVFALPRLGNGKLDYAGVRRMGIRRRPVSEPSGVREVYARVLHRPHPDAIDDDANFVTLGGDSLSYVQASIELERVLGELPVDWPMRTVRQLESAAGPRPKTPTVGKPRRRRLFATVETNIALRALAILVVVGTHVGLFQILGGAHVLLVLAGWSFARFCLPLGGDDRGRSAVILRSTARIAVPSLLILTVRLLTDSYAGPSNLLMVNNYVRETMAVGWFVEVLVHTLLLMSVLFAIGPVRRFDIRHPLLLPQIVLTVAYLVQAYAAAFTGQDFWSETHMVLWFFALGWLAQRARTTAERLLVTGIAAVTVASYFDDDAARALIVIGGLVAVLWLGRVPFPRVLVRPVGMLASASLYIYLTHYPIYHGWLSHLPSLVATVACLIAGIAVWSVAERSVTTVRRRTASLKRGVMAA